jgi:hypothetical protein
LPTQTKNGLQNAEARAAEALAEEERIAAAAEAEAQRVAEVATRQLTLQNHCNKTYAVNIDESRRGFTEADMKRYLRYIPCLSSVRNSLYWEHTGGWAPQSC